MLARAKRLALYPFWLAQIGTGAKSFVDNPVIGSRRLNERGLHARRVALASSLANARREKLKHLVSQDDRAAFERDGFVLKRDFLPPEEFAAMREEAMAWRGPAREMLQGDTITRRLALTPEALSAMPAVARAAAQPDWRNLIRYVGSFDSEPVVYLQTILSQVRQARPDPQTSLHADTFHPTVKAWLFLTDVAEDEGPFVYVPGSHRLSEARLDWERRTSLDAGAGGKGLTGRGSFRVAPEELDGLGLPQPQAFAVPANTLVVADTFGFHARGPSLRPSIRVELWAYGRRNPFLPWAGLDAWRRLDPNGHRRVAAFWGARDRLETSGLGKRNPWRAHPDTSAFDPAADI